MSKNERHCARCDSTKISGFVEDGDILFWYCVKCGYAFHRFNEGTQGYKEAQPHIERINR